MTSYSGKFKQFDSGGTAGQEGTCRLTIEPGGLLLTPDSGAPLAFDLGDIDAFCPGEYELSLKLYTGDSVLLTHFGKNFQNLCHDLLEAYRERLIQCLLLEDLQELERFDGWAQLSSVEGGFSSRSEVRLFRSNLAILPEGATGFTWRLADIDNIDFDEGTYTLGLRSGQDRLILTRLAKRTHELIERLQAARTEIQETGARIVRSMFPFLTPGQFQQVAGVFREGRAVPVSQLNSIHPQIERALLEKTVDVELKVYLDHLRSIALEGDYYAGFKRIRKEAEEGIPSECAGEDGSPSQELTDPESASAGAGPVQTGDDQILHWFFFPLKATAGTGAPANAVAWEATSRSGRATYFFRLLPSGQEGSLPQNSKLSETIASAVQRLNRAIVMLNFRREPIYLPDDALQLEDRYHRYAVACRRIPSLRQLRSSFLGRALHTSPAAWRKQVQAVLSRV